MAAKSLELKGYGRIMISPINIKEGEFETVDPQGKPTISKVVGTRAKTVHLNSDGVEIPASNLCKKIILDDETIIAPKFQQTKEVEADDISDINDNSLIYRALDRKFYSVVTDNTKIRDLVITQNKSLEFPFCAGMGWKLWNAILTNWNGKLIMVCCRGDMAKELEKYSEETLELEIEALPQQKNMKKLVKALVI